MQKIDKDQYLFMLREKKEHCSPKKKPIANIISNGKKKKKKPRKHFYNVAKDVIPLFNMIL
jgi:hypothetical protein